MSYKRTPLLLLIDIQHDYLKSSGMEPHPGTIISHTARLLETARSCKISVVHVWTTVSRVTDNRMPHCKASGTWRCVENTPGHQPPLVLQPQHDEVIIHKSFFSAFSTKSLDQVINAIEPSYLVLTGIHLHACVRATALDAYQRGLEVWIASDATGSNDPLHSAITIRYLEKRGCRFASVESICQRFQKYGSDMGVGGGDANSEFAADPDYVAGEREVPALGEPDIQRIVERTRQAWPSIRALSADQHTASIRQVIQGLEKSRNNLISTIVLETGKPIAHARLELENASKMLSLIVDRLHKGSCPAPSNASVRRRPLGNVAVLTSWNNPVYIPLGKIIPALAYGNTVVWKPAPEATDTSSLLYSILSHAFPDGSVVMVAGGAVTGSALINSPGIDAVTFTGSLSVGRIIQEACARKMIPLQAELGGNNAAIMLEDCDVSAAAKEIARGAFAQAGQRCTATRRAIVMRSILEEFDKYLRDSCSEMVWGDPCDASVQAGPLISAEHKRRVERALSYAALEGCVIERLYPQTKFAADRDDRCFFPPTVVYCSETDLAIVQEELFAPVLVVQTADSFDHALALCNNVKQGLVAAIFTSSDAHICRFLDEAEVGILKINQATDGAEPDLPFGGWKASGIGPAEHGESDREFYTRVQTTYW